MPHKVALHGSDAKFSRDMVQQANADLTLGGHRSGVSVAVAVN